ncbi:MAG: glycosyltransferase [Nitrospira sp.]|nr:glycosyltransferase [Nitrospira sp.]
MALKISLMPIVSDGHGDLCASIEEMVVDSLRSVGVGIQVYSNPDDLKSASDFLLVGLGQWGRGSVREALREAPKYGVRRTLWQLETLPPPEILKSIAARFLLRRTPDRVTGLARLADKLALKRISRETRGPPWCYGDLESRRFSLPFREARRIRAIWRDGLVDKIIVSMESRLNFLRSIGVDSTFVPLGYHPLWGRPLDKMERDLDVVFIGIPTPARMRLLDHMQARLSGAGFHLTVVERDCYGDQRTELLNRAKILIHLRNYPWELTRMRMLMAMGCKALLMAEESEDIKPFLPGRHMVMARHENLADTAIYYLRHEEARAEITQQAYSFVSTELELGKILGKELME